MLFIFALGLDAEILCKFYEGLKSKLAIKTELNKVLKIFWDSIQNRPTR